MQVSLDIAPDESGLRVDSHEENEDESTFFGNFSEGAEYAYTLNSFHLVLMTQQKMFIYSNLLVLSANVDIYIIDTVRTWTIQI